VCEPTYTSSDGTERRCSRISPVHAARILAKDRAEGDGSTLPADVRAALELRAALADGTADDRSTPFGASGPGAAGMIRRNGSFIGAYWRDEYRRRPDLTINAPGAAPDDRG
jgi:hypothetical protein